jgi:beta-mannosidase
MHFWSVWHENRDFEHYYDVRPRFCSEFGFQSFPTMHVVRRFAEKKDWNATSPVMEFHQRSGAGNGKIVETMTRYFRIPTTFESFLYLSQLQQALAIDTAVRFWRSLKPNTMGTLYWQLNDVWPSVSWSSLDHAIGWKTLHYHARRFYLPVALATRIEKGRFILSGLNDTHDPANVEVRLRRVGLDGSPRDEQNLAATIPRDRAIELASAAVPDEADFFYLVEARQAGAADYDPSLRIATFPEKFKRYDLPEATVRLTEAGERGTFVLRTDRPAFFVKPEASGFAGAFDDASFTLLPGEERAVRFRSFDGRLPAPGDIAVTHLAATYR